MIGGSRFVTSLIAVMVVMVCCLATKTNGSSIPMWEFLTRNEKMSHLYKIFSKQVARYCDRSTDCEKNLLISGIRNLQSLDENELDRMDPYQRGAKDIIWRTMTGEKTFLSDLSDGDSSYYGADSSGASGSDYNGLGEQSAPVSNYVRPTSSIYKGPFLVGPMVTRVFPDGRPVPEDAKRPLPHDEDIEDLTFSKIPNVPEIETSNERLSSKKPNGGNNRNNINVYSKPGQRPALLFGTTKNPYYRRELNPLFRQRRLSEISNNSRLIRFY